MTTIQDMKHQDIRQNRITLADALDSGRYLQQERGQRLQGVLRDHLDRYSITGVATQELTDSLWVREDKTWKAYDRAAARGIVPQDTTEIADPTPDLLAQLRAIGAAPPGDGCPPQTARAIGVPQVKVGHTLQPDILWFRTTLLTPDELAEAGIPPNWALPYILDTLDFHLAARLLRQYHNLLGETYLQNDHRKDNMKTEETTTIATRPNGVSIKVKTEALQDIVRAIWVRGRSGRPKALARAEMKAGDLILVSTPSGQPVLHQVIGRPEQEYDHVTRTVGVFANVRPPSMKALRTKLPKDAWWTEGDNQR